jgi:hypothetical protein
MLRPREEFWVSASLTQRLLAPLRGAGELDLPSNGASVKFSGGRRFADVTGYWRCASLARGEP